MKITGKEQSDRLSRTLVRHCSLHGTLAGFGLLGPVAQEHAHGQDEHQQGHGRRRGHQHEAAITRLVPGGVLCGTNQSDMKGNMHHTDSEISKTESFPPVGKASKGKALFVCGRKAPVWTSDGFYCHTRH